MNVFNMMSGQMTPHSIGLTDKRIIKQILFKTWIAYKCNDIIRSSSLIVCFCIPIVTFLMQDSSLKTIIIAFIHSLIYSLGSQFASNIMCSQITYFYIICYYLKLKQREVNNYLRKVIKNKERIKIYNSNQMIAKLNKIYEEIKECDSIFWSKFLALVWVLCTADIAFALYLLSFSGKLTIFIRIVLFYGTILFCVILLIIIQTSSSVNFEAKVTYKLLSSYKFVCIQTKQSVVSMAGHGLKVWSLIWRNVFKSNFLSFSFWVFLKDLESNVRTKSGFPAESCLSLITSEVLRY